MCIALFILKHHSCSIVVPDITWLYIGDYFLMKRIRLLKRLFVNKHSGPCWIVYFRGRKAADRLFSRYFTWTAFVLAEMTSCYVENDSVTSISLSELSSSSSVSDRACVHWGKIFPPVAYNEPFRLPTGFHLLLLTVFFSFSFLLSFWKVVYSVAPRPQLSFKQKMIFWRISFSSKRYQFLSQNQFWAS